MPSCLICLTPGEDLFPPNEWESWGSGTATAQPLPDHPSPHRRPSPGLPCSSWVIYPLTTHVARPHHRQDHGPVPTAILILLSQEPVVDEQTTPNPNSLNYNSLWSLTALGVDWAQQSGSCSKPLMSLQPDIMSPKDTAGLDFPHSPLPWLAGT